MEIGPGNLWLSESDDLPLYEGRFQRVGSALEPDSRHCWAPHCFGSPAFFSCTILGPPKRIRSSTPLWLSVMVDEAVVVSASLLAIARVNNQRDNLLRLVKQGIMEQSDKQLRLEVLTELPSGKGLFDYAHKRFSVGFGKSLRFEVTFAALGYYVSYVIISLLINFLNLRVGSSS